MKQSRGDSVFQIYLDTSVTPLNIDDIIELILSFPNPLEIKSNGVRYAQMGFYAFAFEIRFARLQPSICFKWFF